MLMHDAQVQLVFDLMAQLDEIPFTEEPNLGNDASWVPESAAGKAVFGQLIAPENRQALKKWYAGIPDSKLNPSALNFKASLERAIEERLN